MGVQNLPNSGNKFTGSRMIVPGLGLNTYRVQKNDPFSIRDNKYAGYINASPTPTPSITPTNTPTPSVTPTPTPSPVTINTYTINSIGGTYLLLGFSSSSNTGTVDWGDGNTTPIVFGTQNVTHNYLSPYTGDVVITVTGYLLSISIGPTSLPSVINTYIIDSSQFLNNNTITGVVTQTSNGDLLKYDTCPNLNTLAIKFDTSTNFSELPTSVNFMSFGDNNGNTTLNDDLLNLNQLTGSTYLSFGSGNTIYGDVANIPSNITTLNITGSNTISGNTNDIPATLNQLLITGLNTITGDIADLPPLNVINLEGLNTITGNIANISNMNASNFTIRSNNSTIFGNLSDMVGFSINFFYLSGTSMMISGDTTSIPTNNTVFDVTFDSLTGDFNDVTKSSPLSRLYIKGNSSITYSVGSWPITISALELTTSQFLELPQFDVDQFLIDLDNDATWSGAKQLKIYGDRTNASNAAVASLISKGVTVTVYGP